jgi:hypothetical protein
LSRPLSGPAQLFVFYWLSLAELDIKEVEE